MANGKFCFFIILTSLFSLAFFSCASTKVGAFTPFNYEIQEKQISVKNMGANSFTLAVIPDIQNYTHYKLQKEVNLNLPFSYREILNRQMDFLADNSYSKGGGIEFAVFLGDLVAHGNEYPEEWEYADFAISKIDNLLPFSVVIGNHDYDKWIRKKKSEPWQVSGTNSYLKYFGPQSKHFADKDWYRGSSENGLNSYVIFNGGGYDFLVLALEFEPSDSAINWAQSVLDLYPDLPCILVTHGFLRVSKVQHSGNNRFVKLKSHEKGEGNSGASVFNKLVRKNKSIFLVLCGHAFDGPDGEGMRVDVNDAGFKVYSILSNYQGRADSVKSYGINKTVEENGDGFLRLMTFDFDRKICHVQTYSTEFKTFEIDADSDFFIDLEWGARFCK